MKIVIKNKINRLCDTTVYDLCIQLDKELNNVVCSCKDEYSVSRFLIVKESDCSKEVWVSAKLTKTKNKVINNIYKWVCFDIDLTTLSLTSDNVTLNLQNININTIGTYYLFYIKLKY